METLSETLWDVVISGTGLLQSLLALSLSRSGKKILHIDRHRYYGGDVAAFNLKEVESWMKDVNDNIAIGSKFTDARITLPPTNTASQATLSLKQSRSYTLSLTPQFIYARSRLLQTLISSNVHEQLEFLAVGSWWVSNNGTLQRIPGGREDVFADTSLSMRDKRALMKFLRHLMQDPAGEKLDTELDRNESLQSALISRFSLPSSLHSPILALSISLRSAKATNFDSAVARIKRHMQSMGAFGPGFGAVLPKFGGNSEISQISCRAGAVGGGVYVLGEAIKAVNVVEAEDQDRPNSSDDMRELEVELSNGEKIKTRLLVGAANDLPHGRVPQVEQLGPVQSLHSISIISHPLPHLLPRTSENGPSSAAALVIVADDLGDGSDDDHDGNPIYLQIHSDETGECPNGQCVIYGSVLYDRESSRDRLQNAVNNLIATTGNEDQPIVLWSLSYLSHGYLTGEDSSPALQTDSSGQIIALPLTTMDLTFDDEFLDSVKTVWKRIIGDEVDENDFLRFEGREEQGNE